MKDSFKICLAVLMILVFVEVARAAIWEIQDAGLQDTMNFVNIGWGTDGSLNSRSDIPGNPGTRFNVTLTGSGWMDITIGDNYDLPTDNAGIASATGNGGDLSAYTEYAMVIHNPGNKGFFVALFMNTGWTGPEIDRYYQNGTGDMTWIGPGQTVTLTLDFANASLWTGSAWNVGQIVQNIGHVTNIGFKIGGHLGSVGEVDSGVAFDVDVVSNILELNVQAASVYVKPGESVITDMDVKHLIQRVNGCQAMLGYSSTYFPDPVGPVIAAGGGVWDLVIYDSWDVGRGIPGEIDTAVGVDAQGAVGTDADGTVAKITLRAGVIEGVTQIVFRADDPDNDTRQTFLSDMNAVAVWPNKYDSQNIVIDGTAPVIDINSAKQNFVELLTENGSVTNAVQGVVNITITTFDVLSGLDGTPSVTVTLDGGSAETAAFVSESPAGTFNYTWAVTCSTPNVMATIAAQVLDKSGNAGVATAKHFNASVIRGQILNGGFEEDPDVPLFWQSTGRVPEILQTYTAYDDRGHGLATIDAFEGQYFVMLESGGGTPDTAYSQLTQRIVVNAGQSITGAYFFATIDHLPYNDTATIKLVPDPCSSLTEILLARKSVADVNSYDSMEGWEAFSHTFTALEAGIYTLVLRVEDAIDYVTPSYLAVDALKIECNGSLAGDLNGDCRVDYFDLALLVDQWLNECDSSPWCNDSDLNHSGNVDFVDFSILADNWRIGCNSTVDEPCEH
ncbi:MAG: hypothetical protein ABSG22_09470 [Sedimentisphaerales bacterium]